MLDQVMLAVIDAVLAIPGVRFLMGLVDSKWRPLWAALWIAIIAVIVSRLTELVRRRMRRALVRQSARSRLTAESTRPARADASPATQPESRSAAGVTTPATTTTASTSWKTRLPVPVPVLAAALGAGIVAVLVVAVALPNKPDEPAGEPLATPADTLQRADTALDVRWRSGRMEDDDCIGTFEVARGSGSRARFTAFVIDSAGDVMARDSARVTALSRGVSIDFRFRHVDCDEIADWQLEVTTPKTPSN